MKWTKEPPKVDGWYWAMRVPTNRIVAVYVCDSGHEVATSVWLDGCPMWVENFRAWSDAPIPLPDGEVPE